MMGLADVGDLEGLPQCAYIGDVLADVVITDSAAEPPKTMMGQTIIHGNIASHLLLRVPISAR